MAMTATGRLETARPAWPWPDPHTTVAGNRKLWLKDRPIPLNYDLPLDWHHIVPWNKLRDGWNRLHDYTTAAALPDPRADKERVRNATKAWEVLRLWLHAVGLDESKAIIAQFQAGNFNDAIDSAGHICWAKWNLVEGPTNTHRTLIAEDPKGGDPGGDSFDPFFHGSRNLSERSNALSAWTGELAAAAPNKLNKRHAALCKLRNTPLAVLDPDTWDRLQGEKYKLYKRPTWTSEGLFDDFDNAKSANHHPKWRKRTPVQ